ncbi:MAG: hypothetical protein IJW67_01520, partial [Blautia sp.]|nr:hypothetical protein [Blautia sp.]
ISRAAGAGGRHYEGSAIPGDGNEIFISGKEKSVSRSTVEKGFRNALAIQEKEGCVRGPRKLNIPGAHSYLYSMFLCFGIIRQEP